MFLIHKGKSLSGRHYSLSSFTLFSGELDENERFLSGLIDTTLSASFHTDALHFKGADERLFFLVLPLPFLPRESCTFNRVGPT